MKLLPAETGEENASTRCTLIALVCHFKLNLTSYQLLSSTEEPEENSIFTALIYSNLMRGKSISVESFKPPHVHFDLRNFVAKNRCKSSLMRKCFAACLPETEISQLLLGSRQLAAVKED